MTRQFNVRRARYAFLTQPQIAFFLQVTVPTIGSRVGKGDLQEARLANGDPFRPLGERRILFPASQIAPTLDDDAWSVFVRWQRGEIDIPVNFGNAQPPPLSEIVFRAATPFEGDGKWRANE